MPSARDESKTESVKEADGGESIMIWVKCASSTLSKLRICFEPNNSAGLGGTGPAVSRCKRVLLYCFTIRKICVSLGLLTRHVLSPCCRDMPKIECRRGRRKSASIINTRAPICARQKARFTAVVVFPSPGRLDVTSNVFGGCPGVESSTAVRNCR